MNDKYGPTVIRIVVILIILVGGGFGLITYLEKQGTQAIDQEIARAKALGWFEVAQKTPEIPEHQDMITALKEASVEARDVATKVDEARRLGRLNNQDWLQRASRTATTLQRHRKAIEACAKTPPSDPVWGASEKKWAVSLLLYRAESEKKAGRTESALESLELARLISQTYPGWGTQPAIDVDAAVRLTWCQIASVMPGGQMPPYETSPGAKELELAWFRAALDRTYRKAMEPPEEGQRPLSQRARFDILRECNAAYDLHAKEVTDVVSGWRFIKRALNKHSWLSLESELTKVAGKLKAQAVRDQMPVLFQEALANGGAAPASLSSSVDTYNSGSPMRFRKFAGGFQIYSFGEDGYDGGGTYGDIDIKLKGGRVTGNLRASWR